MYKELLKGKNIFLNFLPVGPWYNVMLSNKVVVYNPHYFLLYSYWDH